MERWSKSGWRGREGVMKDIWHSMGLVENFWACFLIWRHTLLFPQVSFSATANLPNGARLQKVFSQKTRLKTISFLVRNILGVRCTLNSECKDVQIFVFFFLVIKNLVRVKTSSLLEWLFIPKYSLETNFVLTTLIIIYHTQREKRISTRHLIGQWNSVPLFLPFPSPKSLFRG